VNDTVRKMTIDGPKIVFYNDTNIITKQRENLVSKNGNSIEIYDSENLIFLPYNDHLFQIFYDNDDNVSDGRGFCAKFLVTRDDIIYDEKIRFSSCNLTIKYHYIMVDRSRFSKTKKLLDLKTFDLHDNINNYIYIISEDYFMFDNSTNLPGNLLYKLKELYSTGVCEITDEIIDISDKLLICADNQVVRVVTLPEKNTLTLESIYFMKKVSDILIYLKIDSAGFIEIYTI